MSKMLMRYISVPFNMLLNAEDNSKLYLKTSWMHKKTYRKLKKYSCSNNFETKHLEPGKDILDWKTPYLCFNLQAKKLASVLHRKTCWFVANIPPTWCTWAVEHCRSILSLFDWLWCPCFCPLLEACSGICWPHVDFVHKVAWQNCKSWMHHHSDWFERNYSTIAESPRTQSNWDTWSTSTKHRSTWKIGE